MNKIFSIKQNEITCHTEITLFGIKVKIYNPDLLKKPDYTNALKNIQTKFKNKEKIRVAFLVNENSKWNAQELYNLMEQSEYFEPFVLVTLLYDVHIGKDKTRNNIQENYDFFTKRNIKVYKAYNEKEHKYIDLKEFSPDIVFYQQPWSISNEQNIESICDSAICCYYLYGVSIFETDIEDMPFHKKLFKEFIQYDNGQIKSDSQKRYKLIGFPKLDIYKHLKISNNKTNTIIYSCHFGYNPKNAINIGTFPWSGIEMLQFAKAHPQYKWIFKPHPNLKNTLYQDKKYGKDFADKYFEEWTQIAQVKDKGNYYKEFANSDLLISDSCSFLLEYMPTLKPIIRLTNKKTKMKFSKLGKLISQGLYQVTDFNQFKKHFEQIIVQNQDPLLEKRKEIVHALIDDNSASQKIIDYILNIANG